MASVNSIDSYQPVLFMRTYMHGPSEIDSYKTKAVKVDWTDSQTDLEENLEKSYYNISAASQVGVTAATSQVGVTNLQPAKVM